jgi:hypothetical protein
MFKKNAVLLKWVETDSFNKSEENDVTKDAAKAQLIAMFKETTRFTLGAVATYKVIDTLSKITIHIAETKIK